MLTLLLVVLIVLALTNGLRPNGIIGTDSRNIVWTVLAILLIVWLLFAVFDVGDLGYRHGRW